MEKVRAHERTGRPLGDEVFMERLEEMVGRILRRQKPGRKKKSNDK
jgi:putative transposase